MLLSTASPHLGEESRLYDPEMFRCIFTVLSMAKKNFT